MSSASAVSFEILILIASIIIVLLALTAVLTIAQSVRCERQDKQNKKVRSSVQEALLERMEAANQIGKGGLRN